MPLDRADVRAGLLAKGFELEQRGRDHDYYWFVVGGQYSSIYTKVSRGTKYKTIDDSGVAKMARQVNLTRKQFVSLVTCIMSRSEFETDMRNRGLLGGS